jgi:glutaminyl-peptide cyclotransferase
MHRRALQTLCLVPLLAPCFTLGCRDGGADTPIKASEKFEAARAWKHMQAQIAFGARPAGSPAAAELRDWLVAELAALKLSPVREAFTAEGTPRGSVAMENVYADLEGQPGPDGAPAPMICLGAHYDTKRMDFEFLGANDGASGVAALLELARVLSNAEQSAVTYRFLFLDGEEAMRFTWRDPDNCYGSRHHVRQLTQTFGALKRIKAFILLDLVADEDLHLELDSNSTRRLLAIFRKAATGLGDEEIFARYRNPIRDDHEQFKLRGIPALVLIDLHFGPQANEYWHTSQDTLDHCSMESLQRVGNLVLAALPQVAADFCR